jgi:hypothetical protein
MKMSKEEKRERGGKGRGKNELCSSTSINMLHHISSLYDP